MEQISDFLKYAFDWFIKFSKISLSASPVIVIALLLLLFVHYILNTLKRKNALPVYIAETLRIVLRWGIILLSITLVLERVGIPLTNLWTIISAIAALVAVGFFAVWSILSNLFCALLLFIFHPFLIGDEIELVDINGQGLRGKVISINLMFTSLEESCDRTNRLTNLEVVNNRPNTLQIPNNMFFQKIIRVLAS